MSPNDKYITRWGICAGVGMIVLIVAILLWTEKAHSQTAGESVMETGTQSISGVKTVTDSGTLNVPTRTGQLEAVNNERLTGHVASVTSTLTNGFATTNQLTATSNTLVSAINSTNTALSNTLISAINTTNGALSNTLISAINTTNGALSNTLVTAIGLKMDSATTNSHFSGVQTNQKAFFINGLYRSNDNYFAAGSGGGMTNGITDPVFINGSLTVSNTITATSTITGSSVRSGDGITTTAPFGSQIAGGVVTGISTAPIVYTNDMTLVGTWTNTGNSYISGDLTVSGVNSGATVRSGDGISTEWFAGGIKTNRDGNAVTLFSTNLTTLATTLTISGIPQTYKHLRLYTLIQVTNSAAQGIGIQFNGDTSAKYYRQGLSAALTTLTAFEEIGASSISAIIGTALRRSETTTDINFYTSDADKTIFAKRQHLTAFSSGNLTLIAINGVWNSNAPITSLTLVFPAATAATNGSQIVLEASN